MLWGGFEEEARGFGRLWDRPVVVVTRVVGEEGDPERTGQGVRLARLRVDRLFWPGHALVPGLVGLAMLVFDYACLCLPMHADV